MSFSISLIIVGVRADVAHVFIMSFSGMNSLPLHFGHVFTGGLSSVGSTGRSFSFARITSSQFSQYHTGNGIPNGICLEIHQSHFSPFTQFSYLTFINSGYHLT